MHSMLPYLHLELATPLLETFIPAINNNSSSNLTLMIEFHIFY